MTQALPRKLFDDRSKLSRQMFTLSLSLLLTNFGLNNVGIAQVKDTPLFAHHPGGHSCPPPGAPPFGFMDGPKGPPGAPPPPMALPLDGVDLSDEQIEKLAQLHTAFTEQAGPAIFKLHALEEQFRLALSASNLNLEALNSLRSKIATQKVQVDSAAGDYAIAQAQALTPEQRHQVKLDLERFEVNFSRRQIVR